MATTSTLPRPSRPSFGPPSSPLPTIPMPRSRKSSISSITSPNSRRGSGGSLAPFQASARTVSTSSLPTIQTKKAKSAGVSGVSPAAPSLRESATTPTTPASDRPAKKTVSIGSFPQPPKSVPRPNAAAGTGDMPALTPAKQRNSAGTRSAPPRTSSMAKTRVSSRAPSLKMPSNTPSLLDGSGDRKSVTTNHLTLPSPDSRTSSAQGSYTTSATTIEDAGDDDRGRTVTPVDRTGSQKRSSLKDGGKDKGNVIVSVRVRPDAAANEGQKSELEWMVDGRKSLISFRGREGGEYYYDNVFTTHDNNPKVYDAAAKRLVRRVMEGYHGTVFAYGMTGTGKTFSMQGTATNPGVIPLAITDIFSFIRETPHREFLLRVSYLEIYNEKIHDLLAAGATGLNGMKAPQEEIKLREDAKRGVYATPLKEEIVQSPTQLLRVIARGDMARRTGSTQWNARSSRSHAVVQIVVESRERAPGNGAMSENKRSAITPGGVRVSTLSLIDLAGSEKAAEDKERRTEGAHINKSLLTLGTVISNLAGDKDKDKSSAKDGKHLPYRDSKLTRLLQPALQGNSLVSILCTIQIGAAGSVASAQSHTGETLNTLKFASRAKNNIVSHAKKAEEAFGASGAAAALLDRYRLEIVELRRQLEEVKEQNASGSLSRKASSKSVRSMKSSQREKALPAIPKDDEPDQAGQEDTDFDVEKEKRREAEAEDRHEEQMLEMQLARTALKERIEHLNRLILSSKSLGVNASRSFSSLSHQRGSVASNHSAYDTRSLRSSAATIDASGVPNRNSSSASMRSLRALSSMTSSTVGPADEPSPVEDEDTFDENPDGTASLALQVRALQSDLMDKNRYISTLEKRLLQARRSSVSRVSMGFSTTHRAAAAAATVASVREVDDDGSLEAVLREKDDEIAELRARLDDKDRMVSALRSAARKRDMADLKLDTGGSGSIDGVGAGATDSRRSSSGRTPSSHGLSPRVSAAIRERVVSTASTNSAGASPHPGDRHLSTLSSSSVLAGRGGAGGPSSAHKSVDSVTKMLDDMIKEKVQAEQQQHQRQQAIDEEPELDGADADGEGRPATAVAPMSTAAAPSSNDRVDSGISVKSPPRSVKRNSSVRVWTSP